MIRLERFVLFFLGVEDPCDSKELELKLKRVRGVGVRGKDFEIKKVGLDGEKWLVSESFGEASTKEK